MSGDKSFNTPDSLSEGGVEGGERRFVGSLDAPFVAATGASDIVRQNGGCKSRTTGSTEDKGRHFGLGIDRSTPF